jgi:flagellar basal body-associated protein FliL
LVTKKSKSEKIGLTVLTILSLTIVVVFFVGVFVIGSNSTAEPGDEKVIAYSKSQEYVKEQLKAPSSAVFPSYFEINVFYYSNSDEYVVKAYVDAQNSYGAMLRKEYKSTLRYLGEYRWQNLETIIY